MPDRRVRIGNLSRAFGYGKSEMYNRIARICVLYEDLRIETGKLFGFSKAFKNDGEVMNTFEVLYYIRRSTASLSEYRGALNQLCNDQEFKNQLNSLKKMFADHITEAYEYLEDNQKIIKNLRDSFGGHFLSRYVQHATENFPAEAIGKIEWISDPVNPWSLNIDLAANIITSGLGHALQSKEDLLEKFQSTVAIISTAYRQVQHATYALVYCFLWNRLR
jgi:hypothetical protein